MRFNFFLLFCCSILLFLTSCSSDEPPLGEGPVLMPVTDITVKDVANFADARDISVSFRKPRDLSLIESLRILIVPTELQSSFDSIAALNSNAFLSLGTSATSQGIRFEMDQQDVQEEAISENVSYVIFVLSVGIADDAGVLSEPSSAFTLQRKNVVRTLTGTLNEGTGGMDTDRQGNIYVADFGRATNQANGSNVLKITPDGQVSNFASGLNGASGNDFDQVGNLYQSNIAGNTVSKITPAGEVSLFATGFSNPVGIAFDGDSLLYVCNCGNNTISQVDMEGNVSAFASSSLFNCPNGIDIDRDGNLYIASFGSPTIVKITPEGEVSDFATMPGGNNGHLLIHGNSIYVVSRGLHQIHRVSLTGSVRLLAGNGNRGIVDGPLTQASFSLPNDIAFSPDGRYLYVNDVDGSNSDQAVISPSIIRVIELVE
ncbi:MAG: SMP-30/gluconolactonase/LRE family protein [Cytophagales bacterium]|nr:SMP-30/gluconolactonase/LRE family protein [Cytophagales bacterium]